MLLIKPSLLKNELEFKENNGFIVVSSDMQRTLAQLQGYNDDNDKSLLIRTDADGVLLVNTSGASADTITPSVASVGTTATVIVTSRSNRKQLMLRNNGSVPVYIATQTTVAVATGYILDAGSVLTLENFTGIIYGIISTGTCEVRVLEVFRDE